MTVENRILAENEKQANRVVAKVMRITFLIFSLIYILNLKNSPGENSGKHFIKEVRDDYRISWF